MSQQESRSYIAHFERFPVPIAISATSVKEAKRIARDIMAPQYGIDLTERDPVIGTPPRRSVRQIDLESEEG